MLGEGAGPRWAKKAGMRGSADVTKNLHAGGGSAGTGWCIVRVSKVQFALPDCGASLLSLVADEGMKAPRGVSPFGALA